MAYTVAVGQGWVSRSDFWTMPVAEFWWLVAAKIPDFENPQQTGIADIRRKVKAEMAKDQRDNVKDSR